MWIADEDEDEEIVTQDDDQSNIAEEKPDPQAVKGESVRESIKRALIQQSDEGEEEEPAEKSATDKEEPEVKETKDTKSETPDKPKTTAPKISADAPPVGWTKQAKAQWSNLPLEIRESVAKREKEVSDGFKDYGDKVKNFEAKEKDYNEIENVFQPRTQELAKLGVTKSQVVNQMFQWIDAFSHQDKNYARQQLILLGKNYGINLETAPAKPAAQTQQTQTDPAKPEQQQQQQQVQNPVADPRIDAIEQEILANRRQKAIEQNQAAQQYVNNWAKNKPHFGAVRKEMFALLQSGAVPLKNEELDLDSAYDQAVYANPVTRELILKEQADKALVDAKAKKDAKDLANLKKVNKSKVAGSSISARAPTGSSTPNQGKNGKPPSVRDSLKQAIQEARENS